MTPRALVGIRPSMRKFGCQALSVEVCCVARVLPCVINRQVMMALLSVGIPTHTLWDMYVQHVKDLDLLLTGGENARRVCILIIFTCGVFALSMI
jgi:RNA dependent RNA polymerase